MPKTTNIPKYFSSVSYSYLNDNVFHYEWDAVDFDGIFAVHIVAAAVGDDENGEEVVVAVEAPTNDTAVYTADSNYKR